MGAKQGAGARTALSAGFTDFLPFTHFPACFPATVIELLIISFFFYFVKQRNSQLQEQPKTVNSRGCPNQAVLADGETAGCLGSRSDRALATRAHGQ